jgi:hypothetical protein
MPKKKDGLIIYKNWIHQNLKLSSKLKIKSPKNLKTFQGIFKFKLLQTWIEDRQFTKNRLKPI